MNTQLLWKIMLFTSPLIAGSIVALSRPVVVVRYLGKFHNWLWLSSNKQGQDTNKNEFFKKYIALPIIRSLLSMAEWTQGIENEFIRSGVRISSYTYFMAVFLTLLAFATYIVIVITLIIIGTWLFFKILFFILNNWPEQENSSHKQNNKVSGSDLTHLSPEEKQRAHDEGEKWSKRERKGTNGLIESVLPSERSSVWNFDDKRTGGSADERSEAFDAGADNDKKQNKN